MSFYSEFLRVTGRAKLAEQSANSALADDALEGKLQLWHRMKTAARKDPEGLFTGLFKLALDVWGDHRATGIKTAADSSLREALSISFASAALVDETVAKMARDGDLTEEDSLKLAALNAESAIGDLEELTKEALSPSLENALYQVGAHPYLATVPISTAVGAGLGAWRDKDNRLRGAGAGALGGAVVGGLLGKGVSQLSKDPTGIFERVQDALKVHHALPQGASRFDSLKGVRQGVAKERLSGFKQLLENRNSAEEATSLAAAEERMQVRAAEEAASLAAAEERIQARAAEEAASSAALERQGQEQAKVLSSKQPELPSGLVPRPGQSPSAPSYGARTPRPEISGKINQPNLPPLNVEEWLLQPGNLETLVRKHGPAVQTLVSSGNTSSLAALEKMIKSL